MDVLKQCAHFLKALSQPMAAAIVYEKLGDTASIVAVYVETERWDTVRVTQIRAINVGLGKQRLGGQEQTSPLRVPYYATLSTFNKCGFAWGSRD